MNTKRAEKAYQMMVSAPGFPEIQVFLVDGISDVAAERRLRLDLKLPPNAIVALQRSASSHDIERANLMSGGVVRIR